MNLEDLLEEFPADRFPNAAELLHPEKAAVLKARERVADAIKSEDFICDCISLEIDRLSFNEFSCGIPPFYTVPRLGINFAFGYWAPGSSVGAHEHTAWTITAVCSNKLEIITYDRDATYKTKNLVPKRQFEGLSGIAGYIYEPCIHAPRNTSEDWSLTFHVTSPLDGVRPDDCREPLSCLVNDFTISPEFAAHPYLNVVIASQRLQFVDQLIKKLLTINTTRAHSVLLKCLDMCSIRSRNELKDYLGKYIIEDFSTRLLLKISDPKLELQCNSEKDTIVLSVKTPLALLRVLTVSLIAKEAITHIVQEKAFDADSLPGDLTKQERYALAEILEETGLFKRINN